MSASETEGPKGGLFREVVLASLLALAPFVLGAGQEAMWPDGVGPELIVRVNTAVRIITTPGEAVGNLVVAGMDAFGMVGHSYRGQTDEHGLPSDWRRVERIQTGSSAIGNMLMFGAFWFTVRTRPRQSVGWNVAVGALMLWLLFAVPGGVFAALMMVL